MLPEIQVREKLDEPTPALRFSSQGIGNLTKAITLARPNFGVVKKSAENPYYKDARGKPRKYADLAEIIAATAEPLAAQGIYVFQAPTISDGKAVGITTLLAHSSGEWIETTMTGCPADQKLKEGPSRYDAQTIGIGFTYLARYAMRAILNLGSEDDDGQGLVEQKSDSKAPLVLPGKVSSYNRTAGSQSELPLVTVSASAIKVEGKPVVMGTVDADGCPVSDEDVPVELRLPSKEQQTAFGKQLKALGVDTRLLKQWVEATAGTEWTKIPLSKFEGIIKTLKQAEAEGKLLELITVKA